MGRFLLILVLLVAGVIALGYYLDWFQLATSRDPTKQTDIKVRIDEKKIESDVEKATEKVKGTFKQTPDKPEGK
jgi:hypothetical protein